MAPSIDDTRRRLEALKVTANGAPETNTFTEPPFLLIEERKKATFNVRELTYFLDGGKEETEHLEEAMRTIERDPVFQNDDFYDIPKDEMRKLAVDRVAAIGRYIYTAKSEKEYENRLSLLSMVDPGSYTRCAVHYGLFLNGVKSLGTSHQLAYWVKKGAFEMRKFFGCFGMTELGHGSNVAGLETTATFDEDTDEFIINTPNEAATKWWIGGAAHTANHCLVYARLISKGKDYGVMNFVVPLRNVEDHSLLPGISLGDIGKKMGRDAIDNGWIRFSSVRIPRQFMLMKYTKIDSEGEVSQSPLAQLAYAPLIGGRVSMVADSYNFARRFIAIAVRYAAVRRQFSSTPDQPETKLLDYTYHQRRLMPRLAYAFAMKAGSDELNRGYAEAKERLDNTPPNDKIGLKNAIEDVKDIFSLSAGLKAFSTWGTAEIIDECRQACGGQGYSGYNGFGQGYNDWVVQCTWEGDNNILTLSTGRSLIQNGLAIRKGLNVGIASSYLAKSSELAKAKLGGRDIKDPKVAIEAWQSVASQAVDSVLKSFDSLTKGGGQSFGQAMETLSQQRYQIAKIHTRAYLIQAFYNRIEKATDEIKPVLVSLATLFHLWSIENESSVFLKYGYLTSKDLDTISSDIGVYCQKVRDQAVPITDAFNLSDYFINAPIGSYDGNVYKAQFDKVTRRNPPRDSKPPYYESKLKPFLHRPHDTDYANHEDDDEV